MTIVATLAGVLAGVALAWTCWRIFAEDDEGHEGRGVPRDVVRLEPEVTEEDVRSFFAKYDAVERNVPVALVAEWKQIAAEKMAAVQSAEQFAFEQGRLAAFGEMEKAFLEIAEEMQTPREKEQDA